MAAPRECADQDTEKEVAAGKISFPRVVEEGRRITNPTSKCEKQVYPGKVPTEDKMPSAVFCYNLHNLLKSIFTIFYAQWHTCVFVTEPNKFIFVALYCWQYGGKRWPGLSFIIQFEYTIPSESELNAQDLEVIVKK